MVFDISVTINNPEEPIEEKILEAKRHGADRIELKQNNLCVLKEKREISDEKFVDKFIPKKSPLPLIYTFYRPDEEPKLPLWVDDRWQELLSDLENILHMRSIAYVDIESSLPKEPRNAAIKIARNYGATLIISTHHYYDTPKPTTLRKNYEKAKSLGADIIKIVPKNFDDDDVRLTIEFALECCKKGRAQVWGMGEHGRETRLNPYNESTFASFDGSSAEGQMSLEYMVKRKRLYEDPHLRKILWDHAILEKYRIRA